jgi:hypothetical protein
MSAPSLVVEVLLATRRVETRRLQVTHWVHADPHVFPSRRDRERGDPFDDLGIVDALISWVAVFKTAAAPPADDAGRRATRSSESQ